MSRSNILKLTCWITLLLLLVFISLSAQLKLAKPTIKYIKQLYRDPIIRNLINNPQYRGRYLGIVFQHFRDDFQHKRIGNFRNSHWPSLLQDLDLLPTVYHTTSPIQDRRPIRAVWLFLRPQLMPDPIANYHETEVRVPDLLVDVFQHDTEQYQAQTRTIHYDYLVKEMQSFVDSEYGTIASAGNYRRKELLKKITGKVLRFKAIYWLTVMDQFIGVVQQMIGQRVQLGPTRRTELVVGPVAQPIANPLANPAGPSGTNPIRGPSAEDGDQSRGTKRKATHQDGHPSQGGSHKRGPGAVMRSLDGASKEPQVAKMSHAQQSNSGGSTALSWISVIMVTIAVSLITLLLDAFYR